jgi:hypothetical protein
VTLPSDPVRLDLNNPEFQHQLFRLPKDGQLQVLKTLLKLSQMSWNDVYRDSGLRWEAILSKFGPEGARLYSFRISQSFRAMAYRDGLWLRVLSLHPDHDSAYRR